MERGLINFLHNPCKVLNGPKGWLSGLQLGQRWLTNYTITPPALASRRKQPLLQSSSMPSYSTATNSLSISPREKVYLVFRGRGLWTVGITSHAISYSVAQINNLSLFFRLGTTLVLNYFTSRCSLEGLKLNQRISNYLDITVENSLGKNLALKVSYSGLITILTFL